MEHLASGGARVVGGSVAAIATHRVAEPRERGTDLMQEAGARPHLDERYAVAVGQRLPAQDRPARASRHRTDAVAHDGHARRTMPGHGEIDFERSLPRQPPDHECAIALVDPVLAERGPQPEPRRLLGRDQQHAGGIDIQAVDDAAAQSPLADAGQLGPPGHQRVQQRPPFVLAQRMHRLPGRLVDRDPAGPLGPHDQRGLRLRPHAPGVRRGKAGDLDPLAGRDGARLVAIAERAGIELDAAAREQRPHRRPAHAEAGGQHPVEAHAGLGFRHGERGPPLRPLDVRFDVHVRQGSLRRLPRLRASAIVPKPTPPDASALRIQILDTTLRDGEQTPDVAYTPAEKLQLARMLLSEVRVDRIEIAQTRVSEGERQAARRIAAWARRAGMIRRVEIMGYVDGELSIEWIAGVGGKVMNLLAKGSEKHCREQLRLSPEQHRRRVEATIRAAHQAKIHVNVYLEDWSNGVRESFDYVFAMVQMLQTLPIQRLYLPDTLGICQPEDVTRWVDLMAATWPDLHFEFHGHNDYGLATANCLAAVRAGARGVHTSVNGMGERAGNTRLAEVVAALHDHTRHRVGVDETKLASISRLVETFSGKPVAANAPIVGRDVFTQTGGIHADGDAKGDLYASDLIPARFGRLRQYALGKLSGKASLAHNLRALGIELSDAERSLVLARIVELGDRKSEIGPADLPYIIADVLGRPEQRPVRIESYRVLVSSRGLPEAEVEVSVRGERAAAKSGGDGGYDAFMRALGKAVKPFGLTLPKLVDYQVRIPPGGRSSALVQTVITWQGAGATESSYSTLAVDPDQLAAAVLATEKMLNALAMRARK